MIKIYLYGLHSLRKKNPKLFFMVLSLDVLENGLMKA